jgi:hypothetical protein
VRSGLDATGRADLALAMQPRASTFGSDLETLKRELWGAVTFQLDGGRRVVAGVSDPRASFGAQYLGSSTSSLASVFEALVRLDPQNPDLLPLLQALLQRAGNHRGFGSTYDNRRAIAALVAFFEAASPASKETKLSIGDRKFTLDGASKVASFAVDADAPLAAQATGETVKARVRYRYLPEQTGDRAAAQKAGFLVQKSMTLYPEGGGTPQRLDDERAAERALTVGDVVEVHARFTTDTLRHNVAFVVPFAAGFEPLNPELRTASSEAKTVETDSLPPLYVARLDDEVRYYFSSVAPGTYAFHFRVKATTPGSYVQPGAHAELMYDEATMGSSDGMRVVIARSNADTGANGTKQ